MDVVAGSRQNEMGQHRKLSPRRDLRAPIDRKGFFWRGYQHHKTYPRRETVRLVH